MSFLEHLEELRWVLLKSFLAFLLSAVIVIVFISYFSEILRWPYEFAFAGREDVHKGLINTSILGVFSVMFYIMLGAGISLSLPFILYFVAQFVAPGLTEKELSVLRPVCLLAFALFLSGCAFSFFVLVPTALRASVILNEFLGFEAMWTASNYYGMLAWMVLGVGAAFQFPLLLVILVYLEFISTELLRNYRAHAFVVFLCLGAIVTPTTDPVTFLLLALPLSVFYEAAIFGGARVERQRLRRRQLEEQEEAEAFVEAQPEHGSEPPPEDQANPNPPKGRHDIPEDDYGYGDEDR